MAGCFLVKIPVYHMVGIRSTLFGLANIIKIYTCMICQPRINYPLNCGGPILIEEELTSRIYYSTYNPSRNQSQFNQRLTSYQCRTEAAGLKTPPVISSSRLKQAHFFIGDVSPNKYGWNVGTKFAISSLRIPIMGSFWAPNMHGPLLMMRFPKKNMSDDIPRSGILDFSWWYHSRPFPMEEGLGLGWPPNEEPIGKWWCMLHEIHLFIPDITDSHVLTHVTLFLNHIPHGCSTQLWNITIFNR